MKRTQSFVIVLALATIVGACGSSPAGPSATPPPPVVTPPLPAPVVVSVATIPPYRFDGAGDDLHGFGVKIPDTTPSGQLRVTIQVSGAGSYKFRAKINGTDVSTVVVTDGTSGSGTMPFVGGGALVAIYSMNEESVAGPGGEISLVKQ